MEKLTQKQTNRKSQRRPWVEKYRDNNQTSYKNEKILATVQIMKQAIRKNIVHKTKRDVIKYRNIQSIKQQKRTHRLKNKWKYNKQADKIISVEELVNRQKKRWKYKKLKNYRSLVHVKDASHHLYN